MGSPEQVNHKELILGTVKPMKKIDKVTGMEVNDISLEESKVASKEIQKHTSEKGTLINVDFQKKERIKAQREDFLGSIKQKMTEVISLPRDANFESKAASCISEIQKIASEAPDDEVVQARAQADTEYLKTLALIK